MNKLETLNTIAHLERSRFGRLHPRHGLKLLYWFANDCISFDNSNNIIPECDPENGDYGFHIFENRYDRNGVKLLPDVDYQYYLVGNLNSPGADELPDYVSEDSTSLRDDDSNMDRIIISICDYDWVDRVYVTEHNDRTNFDRSATYRISKGLLMAIRKLELDDFLSQAGYQKSYIFQFPLIVYDPTVVRNPDPRPTNPTISNVRPQNQSKGFKSPSSQGGGTNPTVPNVRPHKVEECHVVIQPMPESENKNDNLNDTALGGYSDTFLPRNRSRKTCCECTIL